jgi:putative spermidine/putrescine transport system substrate-binding protein
MPKEPKVLSDAGSIDSDGEGWSISRRQFLKTAGVVAGGVAASSFLAACTSSKEDEPEVTEEKAPAQMASQKFKGESIVLQGWGDGTDYRQIWGDKFEEETGATLNFISGYTSQSIAKIKATASRPEIDVSFFDAIGGVVLGKEGLLDTLDLSQLPNALGVHPKFIVAGGKALGFGFYCNTLIHQSEVVTTAPTSYAEMWKPEYQEKTTYPFIEWTDGLKWIIACALAQGEDAFTISDATWDKIAELKENQHSIHTNQEATAELFKSGEIVFGFSQPGMWREWIQKGYPIVNDYNIEEGFFAEGATVALVKGHKAPTELCYDFINRVLAPDVQKAFAERNWWSPVNPDVELSAELAQYIPSGVDDLENARLTNHDLLSAVRVDWIERYKRL